MALFSEWMQRCVQKKDYANRGLRDRSFVNPSRQPPTRSRLSTIAPPRSIMPRNRPTGSTKLKTAGSGVVNAIGPAELEEHLHSYDRCAMRLHQPRTPAAHAQPHDELAYPRNRRRQSAELPIGYPT